MPDDPPRLFNLAPLVEPARPTKPLPPTHLLAHVGDRRAACGVRNPLPVMLARHAHRRPDLTFCPACLAATD